MTRFPSLVFVRNIGSPVGFSIYIRVFNVAIAGTKITFRFCLLRINIVLRVIVDAFVFVFGTQWVFIRNFTRRGQPSWGAFGAPRYSGPFRTNNIRLEGRTGSPIMPDIKALSTCSCVFLSRRKAPAVFAEGKIGNWKAGQMTERKFIT